MQEVLVRLDSGHFDSVDTWWRTCEEYIWHLLEKMWKTYFQGTMDFTKFRTLDMKLLDRVDKMLSDDIAKLMVKHICFTKIDHIKLLMVKHICSTEINHI